MNAKQLTFGVMLLAIAVAAAYFFAPAPDRERAQSDTINATFTLPSKIPGQDRSTSVTDLTRLAVTTRQMGNPLERSEDLRATYLQFNDSKDAVERHIAYRAWSACFPTFIAPQGQAVSVENLTKALPLNDPSRAARVDAYRGLLGRCKNFSDMTRDETVAATQRQQDALNSGAILSPGEIAAKYLTEGNQDEALKMVRSILASRDPFSISSLREFVNQFMVLQIDAQAVHSSERPDLRSLAFSFAACQMGMECGPGSLTALQMCASIGECSGSVTDRYLHALPNQADRDALQAESRRVVDAIQSGNFKALGF